MPPRPAALRINDWYEVYPAADPAAARAEGKRCMNCGAAFCMPDSGYAVPAASGCSSAGASGRPLPAPPTTVLGCPIANKIPEWNELVHLDRWRDAYDRLSLTNPFPEFTSRICPAPCQDACILGINEPPVQIKGVERAIIDHAFAEGWVRPPSPDPGQSGRGGGASVGVIGSGPAGLAAADRLVRRGYAVTVYERSDRAGGLLMYGVPNMKLDKAVVQRRVDLLAEGGVRFELGIDAGRDVGWAELRERHAAVLLAVGAQRARGLDLPGRSLLGVREAMDYLTAATRDLAGMGGPEAELQAAGRDVVVIGGGDTGADCLGTALRQGCRSLVNITRRESPPATRDADHPWPGPTGTFQVDYAHAEGAARDGRDPRRYQVQPLAFVADPADPRRVGGVRVQYLHDDSQQILPASLVLLAIGFTGQDNASLTRDLPLEESRGVLVAPDHRTSAEGVYVAGDCRRGASLIVWAIREGLAAADAIDHDLHAAAPGPGGGGPRVPSQS